MDFRMQLPIPQSLYHWNFQELQKEDFYRLFLIRKYLKRDGSVILLVANSSYAEIPIPTDLLIAEAATKQGFKVTSIKKVRRLTTSGQQWKRMDPESREFLRESLLTLQK